MQRGGEEAGPFRGSPLARGRERGAGGGAGAGTAQPVAFPFPQPAPAAAPSVQMDSPPNKRKLNKVTFSPLAGHVSWNPNLARELAQEGAVSQLPAAQR